MRHVPLLLRERATPPARLEVDPDFRVAPGEAGNAVRLTGLPVLLAGPILRRAGADEVVVWLATSVQVTVAGRVLDLRLDSNGRSVGAPQEVGRGRGRPVQVATNLFITHLAITPRPAFPTGRILAYDLTFEAPPGSRFAGGEGLVEKRDLTYGSLGLPTFILDPVDPERRRALRRTVFMHGSCRKLCGPGPDMAPKLDEAIGQSHLSLEERPRFLLLTGDQVYGDDVPADLLRAIMSTSRLLMGFRDMLPGTISTLDTLFDRGDLVRTQGGLTSTHADQHLLGFGEYAAIYLFAWSPAIWDCAALQSSDTVANRDLAQARERNYQDAISMRKAMANVPCYMMVDDHEVTDDWPLDHAMVRQVENSRCGEWIIANGTAAAFYFQLQGNLAGRNRTRYSHVAISLQNYAAKGVEAESPTAVRIGQNPVFEFADARTRYVRDARRIRGLHAVAPTVPEVMLIDTRTHRQLTESGPPGLLNAAGRQWIRDASRELVGLSSEPLIVVSPPPVVGNPLFESAQGIITPVVRASRAMGRPGGERYAADCEAWGLNETNLSQFLDAVRNVGRKIVFVSGDVHFAFTAIGNYSRNGSSVLKFVQMTGSSMRNKPLGVGDTATRVSTISSLRCGSGTLRYGLLTAPDGLNTLTVENNVSRAAVRWGDGATDIVSHTIISSADSETYHARF